MREPIDRCTYTGFTGDMNNNEATTASVFVAVTNRAGKTATYEITAARREIFGGSTAEEVAVNIAMQTGHVKRYTNPTAVVRVEK